MSYDLIVVGAGILGTFHAYHALERGLKVLLIEKDIEPREATVRNFGQVVPSGMALNEWLERGIYATQLYKDVQAITDIGIRNNGTVYVANTEDEWEVAVELHERHKSLGYSSELLTKNQVLAKYPSLREDYAYGGLFYEQEVTAESRYMIHNLRNYMLQKFDDLSYLNSVLVESCVSKENFAEVELSNGDLFEGEKVIICSGGEFKALYPEIFNSSDLELCKLQMMSTYPVDVKLPGSILTGLTIRRYESFKDCDAYQKLDTSIPDQELIDLGVHVLFKQRIDGSIIIGDSHEYFDAKDADKFSFDQDMSINNKMIEAAKNIMDFPHWNMELFWSGYYSQMKSGKGDIFNHKIDERISIVTGIGGKGMTGSAGYAKENIEWHFSSSELVV